MYHIKMLFIYPNYLLILQYVSEIFFYCLYEIFTIDESLVHYEIYVFYL